MNTYAQTTPTPPSAGTAPNGITYAYSETGASLAISLSFNESRHPSILAIINAKISNFNGDILIVDGSTYYEKVELKPKSLKLEIRSKDHVTPPFSQEKEKLKAIYNEIMAL